MKRSVNEKDTPFSVSRFTVKSFLLLVSCCWPRKLKRFMKVATR
jgi:hypothetical protein